jgi:hypothetical protein
MNLQIAKEKLTKLSTLEHNWDSYGAEPPNEFALQWASITLDILEELGREPNALVPSVENGIGICFINGDKFADIEFFNEGEILATTFQKKLSLDNLSLDNSNPNIWEVGINTDSIRETLEVILDTLRSKDTEFYAYHTFL